jgi:hypothetical protein
VVAIRARVVNRNMVMEIVVYYCINDIVVKALLCFVNHDKPKKSRQRVEKSFRSIFYKNLSVHFLQKRVIGVTNKNMPRGIWKN